MTLRARILDAAVRIADRLEDDAAPRIIAAPFDVLIGQRSDPRIAASLALGCVQFAASLTLRIAAKRLGRPSFSPLMAWAQGLDDEDLRGGATMGDA